MATTSEVKTGLDDVAKAIALNRVVLAKAVQDAIDVSAVLAELPTTYADLIATIQAYGTTNAFEALSKAEMAKLTTEFNALKADADTIAAVDLGD